MKRPDKNISGRNIAAARKAHRPPLTQLELSKRAKAAGADLDRAAIAKIENGLRGVLDFELGALARSLGLSPMRLLAPKAPGERRRSQRRA